MENELFHQMKPRLQKLILDSVFSQFYKTFETIFDGCEQAFQRELFMHSEYTFFHDELPDEEDEWSPEYKNDGERSDPIDGDKAEPFPCGCSYQDHVWYDKPQKPIILESGKKSDKIYLVISGPVYIMDAECQFEYGVLYDGSYFGDISLFFNEPNQFSYAYSPF